MGLAKRIHICFFALTFSQPKHTDNQWLANSGGANEVRVRTSDLTTSDWTDVLASGKAPTGDYQRFTFETPSGKITYPVDVTTTLSPAVGGGWNYRAWLLDDGRLKFNQFELGPGHEKKVSPTNGIFKRRRLSLRLSNWY